MPTILQENLADEIVKNVKRKRPKNKKELVVSSGYGEVTADKHASEVIEQKGVQDALEDRGFSIENAKRVVKQILNNEKVEPNARLKASDQMFKVLGGYAPEKSINVNLHGEIMPDEELEDLADKLNGTTKPRHKRTSIASHGVASNALDTKVQD